MSKKETAPQEVELAKVEPTEKHATNVANITANVVKVTGGYPKGKKGYVLIDAIDDKGNPKGSESWVEEGLYNRSFAPTGKFVVKKKAI